jgi:hypothetical protein
VSNSHNPQNGAKFDEPVISKHIITEDEVGIAHAKARFYNSKGINGITFEVMEDSSVRG